MKFRGRIYCNTIELETDPGIPDAQTVEIEVRVIERPNTWGEGIRQSAGIATDVPGVEEAFEELARDRNAARLTSTNVS
jgi:hypothetical protein